MNAGLREMSGPVGAQSGKLPLVTKGWKHRKSAGRRGALSSSADMLAALSGLTDLRDRRALTHTEFQEAKTQLLDPSATEGTSAVAHE